MLRAPRLLRGKWIDRTPFHTEIKFKDFFRLCGGFLSQFSHKISQADKVLLWGTFKQVPDFQIQARWVPGNIVMQEKCVWEGGFPLLPKLVPRCPCPVSFSPDLQSSLPSSCLSFNTQVTLYPRTGTQFIKVNTKCESTCMWQLQKVQLRSAGRGFTQGPSCCSFPQHSILTEFMLPPGSPELMMWHNMDA